VLKVVFYGVLGLVGVFVLKWLIVGYWVLTH